MGNEQYYVNWEVSDTNSNNDAKTKILLLVIDTRSSQVFFEAEWRDYILCDDEIILMAHVTMTNSIVSRYY